MASNFRKAFNFRDGMQVATDDLVVSSNKVGIGTTAPARSLSVYGPSEFIGVATFTDAFHVGAAATFIGPVPLGDNVAVSAAGSVTATSFYGDGATLSNLPTSQWVDTDVGLGFTSIYAAGNVGVGTTDPRWTLQVGGNPLAGTGYTYGFIVDHAGNTRSEGISTALRFDGFLEANLLTGKITTDILPENLTITGIATASEFTGRLVGMADTAETIKYGIDATFAGLAVTNLNVTGVGTFAELNVGSSGTCLTALDTGNVGLGTENPGKTLSIVKNANATIEVISETGQANVAIGQSVGFGNSSAQIRFGQQRDTLDILNNTVGGTRFISHNAFGSVGFNTGNWAFIYGQTGEERFSITWDGKVAVGNPLPTETFTVVGTSTVTSTAYVGGNLEVVGNVSVGSIALPTIISGTNLNNTTGISTFNDLNVIGITTLGVTTATTVNVQSLTCALSVAISTTTQPGGIAALAAPNKSLEAAAISLTNSPVRAIVDAGVGVGSDSVVGAGLTQQCMLIVPSVDTMGRVGLVTFAGAIVFDTSDNKFKGWTGTQWKNFHT
jgi:hypothetical protein